MTAYSELQMHFDKKFNWKRHNRITWNKTKHKCCIFLLVFPNIITKKDCRLHRAVLDRISKCSAYYACMDGRWSNCEAEPPARTAIIQTCL